MKDDENTGFSKLDSFLEKESLNNLAFCIVLTVGFTQILKMVFPFAEPRILVLTFGALLSFARMYLNNNLTKENIKERLIIALFNIVPIVLGAIGSYELIIETILKIKK
jgi:hypothetical protein